MECYRFTVGPVCTNCYFAVNTETKETLIIDPGAAGAYLIEQIEKEELHPVAVLLTHGHFDHATAAASVAEHFGVKIYAHEQEKETLETPALNLCAMTGETGLVFHADIYVKDGYVEEVRPYNIKNKKLHPKTELLEW